MDWPDKLPGLDIDKALANINGKTELYLKLLQIFMDNHREDAAKISQHIDHQEWKQAHMQAHSLKGVSSNIGASDLSTVCQHIEHKTKNEQTDLNEDLQQLRESFSQVTASIENLLKSNQSPE
jgi:HPt (histidine-containing phosphotransfer) domain-containing protein